MVLLFFPDVPEIPPALKSEGLPVTGEPIADEMGRTVHSGICQVAACVERSILVSQLQLYTAVHHGRYV